MRFRSIPPRGSIPKIPPIRRRKVRGGRRSDPESESGGWDGDIDRHVFRAPPETGGKGAKAAPPINDLADSLDRLLKVAAEMDRPGDDLDEARRPRGDGGPVAAFGINKRHLGAAHRKSERTGVARRAAKPPKRAQRRAAWLEVGQNGFHIDVMEEANQVVLLVEIPNSDVRVARHGATVTFTLVDGRKAKAELPCEVSGGPKRIERNGVLEVRYAKRAAAGGG